MDKVVLVCGAAGFIGSHAVASFARAGWRVVASGRPPRASAADTGHRVRVAYGDFSESQFVETLLRGATPDHILFAAGPSDVQASVQDPLADYCASVPPLFRVLEVARRLSRPPSVTLVSSAAVYGEPSAIPIDEGADVHPMSPYGFHKLHQETLLDEFSALYGLRTSKARVFSTFGAGLDRLAVWDITRRAMKGVFLIKGTGGESRDYLHVVDVAAALECIASRALHEGEVINVAAGVEVKIANLANEIFAALGVLDRPVFDGSCLAGSPTRWRADVERLKELGFEQTISFEEGILSTVEWIRRYA